jgi:hypothetical protein
MRIVLTMSITALVAALATPALAAGPCKPSDIEIKQLDRVASRLIQSDCRV